MQVNANFSLFGHPTQVNASWLMSINLLLANEIQDIFALRWVFCDLHVLGRKLACPFGHPTHLRKFNLLLLVTTCESVWPGHYSRAVGLVSYIFLAQLEGGFKDPMDTCLKRVHPDILFILFLTDYSVWNKVKSKHLYIGYQKQQ